MVYNKNRRRNTRNVDSDFKHPCFDDNQDPIPQKNLKRKQCNDNDLIDIVTNKHFIDEDEGSCPNPLCDHKPYVSKKRKRIVKDIKSIESIDDLITLGKSYHCKRNTEYYGVNIRTLSKLVPPLTKLKNMVGMKKVKENIIDQIIFYLQKLNKKNKCYECNGCLYGTECQDKNKDQDMMHTIITGPPGVGKTELGKILGHIYNAMGVLENGDLHVAKRSDLVGKYLGHTATKTQKFIDKCRGGVMFIDEAYSLGNEEQKDSFSKECIDTINQNLTENRNFICIIAGYADSLDKCFFQYNEGLKRRFSFKYDIENYSYTELKNIFVYKIDNSDWDIHESALPKLEEFFKNRKSSFPNFGGDIETLIMNCKIVHGKRVIFLDNKHKKIITMEDIEKGFSVYKDHRITDKLDKKNIDYNNLSTIYI